jgi:hypothetical protein
MESYDIVEKDRISTKDIILLTKQYKSLSPEQMLKVEKALIDDVKEKLVEYRMSNGIEPAAKPLKNYQEGNLGSSVSAWLEMEYIIKNNALWNDFRKGKIDFDTLLKKTVSKYNRLTSIRMN